MDLIDRDVACQKMTALYEEDCRMYGVSIPECFDHNRAIKALKELPSAEPEIIRCKDCKHMIINEKHEAKPMICCFTKMCGTTEPDWFCADGEREDDE